MNAMTLRPRLSKIPGIVLGGAVLSACGALSSAQTNPAIEPASPAEAIVRMSQFEVTTTQGIGYVSTTAEPGGETAFRICDLTASGGRRAARAVRASRAGGLERRR